MDKHAIRVAMRRLKSEVTATQKQSEALKVFEAIELLDQFKKSNNILLYYSLPDELPTHDIVKKWAGIKNIFLPRVNGNDLYVVPLGDVLSKDDKYGIDEPTGDAVSPSIIDLIIVPAVALDRKCQRLGRGKGFYDRLLTECNAYKIGVCLTCQLIDEVPTEKHDVPLDAVVTATHHIKI